MVEVNNKDYQKLLIENEELTMDNKRLMEENDRLKKLLDYINVNMKKLNNI